MKNNKDTFWQAVGVFAVIALIVFIIREINKKTSTKLYSDEGLKFLDDEKNYKKINEAIEDYRQSKKK